MTLSTAERAGELKADGTFAAGFGAHAEVGFCVERSVGENGSVDLVVERGEVTPRRRLIGQRIRGPDIVEAFGSDFFRLADERRFEALRIDHHVERAAGVAFDCRVEERFGVGGDHAEKNSQAIPAD